MLPPSLSWLPSYTDSIAGALGSSVTFVVHESVNPLEKKVELQFGEDQSGGIRLQVWNLFQQYAHANDCLPQGKIEQKNPRTMVMRVGMKRRLGPKKDAKPWDK
jgi:hypothetical protein